LFRQPGEVGQRREVSFFILADPAVDRLLRVAQGQGRLRGVVSVDLPPLVIPFAGERYAAMDQLTALLAPPYDVISRAERVGYAARDPHNIVHLILPEAPSGADPYAAAAARLAAWRRRALGAPAWASAGGPAPGRGPASSRRSPAGPSSTSPTATTAMKPRSPSPRKTPGPTGYCRSSSRATIPDWPSCRRTASCSASPATPRN